MGRMKDYYMQLIEQDKMRDPNVEFHNDDAYWANREYWEEQYRLQNQMEEHVNNIFDTDPPDGDNSNN